MTETINNNTPDDQSPPPPSDKELLAKHFEDLLIDHQKCKDEVAKYQTLLKEFHNAQAAANANCQAHYKEIEKTKKMIKSMNIKDEEKRNKLQELADLKKESHTWKSFFPKTAKGFLFAFIGPADVRMLNPIDRQNYKYVCSYYPLYLF